jgi:hypothetical protein
MSHSGLEGRNGEDFQVPQEIALNQFNNVRGAGDHKVKIRRAQTLRDSFHPFNTFFNGGVLFQPHIEKRGLVVLRKEYPLVPLQRTSSHLHPCEAFSLLTA